MRNDQVAFIAILFRPLSLSYFESGNDFRKEKGKRFAFFVFYLAYRRYEVKNNIISLSERNDLKITVVSSKTLLLYLSEVREQFCFFSFEKNIIFTVNVNDKAKVK